MSNLSIYLRDHHAGSISALELLDRLIESYSTEPWQSFFTTLKIDIQQDQDTLKSLIQTQDHQVQLLHQAAGWAVEKLSRAKVRLDDELGLFQALELLVLGITGKFCLWQALESASSYSPILSTLDIKELKERAVSQRQRVEQKRIEVAARIFTVQVANEKVIDNGR